MNWEVFLNGFAFGLVAMFVCGIVVAVSRAAAARMATGKWPHEDEQSMEIFRGLP